MNARTSDLVKSDVNANCNYVRVATGPTMEGLNEGHAYIPLPPRHKLKREARRLFPPCSFSHQKN